MAKSRAYITCQLAGRRSAPLAVLPLSQAGEFLGFSSRFVFLLSGTERAQSPGRCLTLRLNSHARRGKARSKWEKRCTGIRVSHTTRKAISDHLISAKLLQVSFARRTKFGSTTIGRKSPPSKYQEISYGPRTFHTCVPMTIARGNDAGRSLGRSKTGTPSDRLSMNRSSA